MTPLDHAHAAMMAAPEDDAERLRFLERLADAELFLLLEAEPKGDNITPRLFETEDGTFLLIFDREDRLTTFTDGPAPYAAMSGRAVARMIEAQNIGIGLNLGVAPSAFLLPASGVSWLNTTLGQAPSVTTAKPAEIKPPANLPERLIQGLDTKLATTEGMADWAALVAVEYADGRHSHMLAMIGAHEKAQPALAAAISEALVFSGLDAGELDVAFFAAGDPITDSLERHGLRFDLPQPQPGLSAPDPSLPPKLR